MSTIFLLIFLGSLFSEARTPLSWENTTAPHPERAPWSDHLLALSGQNLNNFSTASDWSGFCPKWKSLNNEQKKVAIAELVIATTYYESGYNPLSRMVEEGLGNDPYTGAQIASEGLLQLSYADKKWAPWCDFNWKVDKWLSLKERSILDPIKNLSCGVRIMGNQIAKNKAIVISKNAYWSVLKAGHRNQKIKLIQDRVKKKAPGCI